MLEVLLADPQKLLCDTLQRQFRNETGITISGTVSNTRDLFTSLEGDQHDIVLYNPALQERDPFTVLATIRDCYPQVRILLIEDKMAAYQAARMIKAGAHGYFTKTDGVSELLNALRLIGQGNMVIPARVQEELFYVGEHIPGKLHNRLSRREFEVLYQMTSGKTNKEISAILGISVKTVSTHRMRILRKLGCANNIELIRYVLRHKLVN